MGEIINNTLSWDGSHLGSYPINVITNRWMLEGIHYYGITLPNGIIYCMATCTRDLFPCIVEDIKVIFNIPRRGVHRITIGNDEYILYYVPISIKGDIIWETPLNRLDAKHPLRKNEKFKIEIQRLIAFCDILALCNTGEPSIRIRPWTNGEYIPINVNETNTSITKEIAYDYSILTKTLFLKWFGEETCISDIIRDMVHYRTPIGLPNIKGIEGDNLAIITSNIRGKIDGIIKRYDPGYIWYSCFIIDRLSRHLLNGS